MKLINKHSLQEVKIMPRRDGTGPMRGQRGDTCNIDNRNFNRCFGGYGFQRGYRRQFMQTDTPGYSNSGYSQNMTDEEKKSFLESQKIQLENKLKLIKERLSDFNTTTEQ